MARKRYSAAQLSKYDESFLWCRSFGHAWEFEGDKIGRRGNRITIEEEVSCLHCGMTRYDWREGVTLVRRRYVTPENYYLKGKAGRSSYNEFQEERIARKLRKKMKSRSRNRRVA